MFFCFPLFWCVCVKPLESQGTFGFLGLSPLAGGQPHIAVDCPTKRAAIVADIWKGRFPDVPALF